MFKRELEINLKSFCIWVIFTIIIFLIVFLVYPSIINSTEIEHLNEMIKMFPKEIIKAFNMDISEIDKVFGWIKSEGFVFILIIISSYASIFGSNIMLKEESDKTIEYLVSLPIKRKTIVLQKCLVGLIYVVSFTLIIAIFNYVGLVLTESFDAKQYILLSLTPILSSVPIFFISMYLSTFTNKTKKMLGLSLGFVFISYILNILSSLSNNIEFLKYFSAFTLSDIRNVIIVSNINIIMVIISIIISVIFMYLTINRYNKKEFL